MQYTIPHYYKDFACIAGACPDTCCAGWQIQIDDASLRKYRKTKGPFRARLLNEIDWKEKCFRRYHGRCAFLNEENLCDLYLEGGKAQAFCRTCRTYPRHIEEFEGLREISLSLSCPEAARIILGLQEPVRFLHGENPDRKETEAYPDFDFLLFTKLMDARSLMLELLQNRNQPIRLRLAVILALSHDLQQRIDRNRLFQADQLLSRYASARVWPWFFRKLNHPAVKGSAGNMEGRSETLQKIFHILEQLESLRMDWKPFLKDCQDTLRNAPCADPDLTEKFSVQFTDIMTEQLMAYFLFTYFGGAVYSQNADGKTRFSFVCVMMIRQLAWARYLKEPENFSRETVMETAWRFSREIEHSDSNKYRLEHLLGNEDLFSLEELFSLLPD